MMAAAKATAAGTHVCGVPSPSVHHRPSIGITDTPTPMTHAIHTYVSDADAGQEEEEELLRQLPAAAADGEVYVLPGTPQVGRYLCLPSCIHPYTARTHAAGPGSHQPSYTPTSLQMLTQ